MRVALAAVGVLLIAATAGGAAGAPRAEAAPNIVELAWSPNGKWMAYLVQGSVEGPYSLNVVRADRVVQRRVVQSTQWLSGIAWSRDSKQLAVRQNGNFCVTWISAANGRGARQVEGCFEDWSPDSRRFVLYRETDRSLYVVDNRSGESRFLAQDALDARDTDSAEWSPDGARIAFSRFTIGSGSRVFSIRANGSDLRQEGADPSERGANQIVAGWSRDSTQLAYIEMHGRIRDLVSKAFVVAADGSRRSTQISDNPSWVLWSPGGGRLAVLEHNRVFATFAARIVTPGGATVATLPDAVELDWRPNGASVVFRGSEPYSGWALYTARADGTGTRRLGPGQLPAWSKLGWIAYAYRGNCADGGQRVYVVRPNGTQRHALSRCRATG